MLFIRGAVALGSSLIIVRRLLPSTASSFVLAIESFRPQHVRSAWSRHVDCFRLLAFGIVHVEFHLFALSLWVNIIIKSFRQSHSNHKKKYEKNCKNHSFSSRSFIIHPRGVVEKRDQKKKICFCKKKGARGKNFFFPRTPSSQKRETAPRVNCGILPLSSATGGRRSPRFHRRG